MRCLHFPIGAKGKGEEARASGGKGGFQFPAILAVIGMGWEGVVRRTYSRALLCPVSARRLFGLSQYPLG
jgi:hypothetical protein